MLDGELEATIRHLDDAHKRRRGEGMVIIRCTIIPLKSHALHCAPTSVQCRGHEVYQWTFGYCKECSLTRVGLSRKEHLVVCMVRVPFSSSQLHLCLDPLGIAEVGLHTLLRIRNAGEAFRNGR